MDEKPECVCDDQWYGEYCEACDGPYEEWKSKIEEESKRKRQQFEKQ